MGIIKSKIKSILKYFGFYRTKSIWTKLSKKQEQFLVQNVRIKSSLDTINDIKSTIENKERGAYMRFGDGDIFLMLGKDDLLHKANRKMAFEMKEAMKINIGKLHKGFSIHSKLFGYENGMNEGMHLVSDSDALKFITATYRLIDIYNIYTPVALHYLATFNQKACVQFLVFLRSTNPIFVGNKNLSPQLLRKLFSETHVKTPISNSYLEIDRIEKDLIQELNKKKNEFQVIVVAMGCPGRILQKRILKKGYNVYLFDFGSLLDAFNDDNTRLWIDLAGGTNSFKDILDSIN
jgi:hypothetical protein